MSIEEICKKYKIESYTINDDGSIDVDGSVFLNDDGLTELPLTFNKVSRMFNCSNNYLTTLKGAPKYVGSGCYLHNNELDSLEYCPEYVGGGFWCNINKLTSLKGCPKSIIGDFDCMDNNLLDLKEGPNEVGGSFFCSNNKLTSLKKGPEKIGGEFECSINNLTDLQGCPKRINSHFTVDNNNLNTFKGCPEYVDGHFDLSDNYLREIDYLPKFVKLKCFIGGNPISSILKPRIDLEYLSGFKSFRVINDDVVNFKRLKYFQETFGSKRGYYFDEMKSIYKVNNY